MATSVVFGLAFGVGWHVSNTFTTVGMTFNVWGAFLLATGYLEEILIASAIWGGKKKLGLAKSYAPRGRWGTALLIIGFLFIAIAQFI